MLWQDEPRAEYYVRRGNEQWLLIETTHLGTTLDLESIGCKLALAEVSNRAEFPHLETWGSMRG